MNIFWTPALLFDMTLKILTGHVDAHLITAYADSLNVPRPIAWAVAWEESRDGRKGNAYLGPGKLIKVDSVTYRRVCREIGRFQINPCTWKSSDPRCTLQRIRDSLTDNIYCGVKHLAWLRQNYGSWSPAVRRFNGRGRKAEAYGKRVEHYVGRVTILSYS